MFRQFAHFFIKNSKLTLVLVLVILLWGVSSYIVIPKQYNPTIEAPAYSLVMSSFWLDASENYKYISRELENKIMELRWIDKVYTISWDNYIQAMIQFEVGEDRDDTTTRLNQQINQNLNLKPYWVWDPIVNSINPDDLPQITIALSYTWDDMDDISAQIYLKQVAHDIKNQIRLVWNTTTLDIIWWLEKNIIISLDLDILENIWLNVSDVYGSLKINNIDTPIWDFNTLNGEKIALSLHGALNNVEKLKRLEISSMANRQIYLWDIATFSYGRKRLSSYVKYSDNEHIWVESVLFWVGKKFWTNSVKVVDDIKDKLDDIQKTLPRDISIQIIQDEWLNADIATTDLITDLFISIAIVIVVLFIFLWLKNALNTATSIPIIISLVFITALILWYDINRVSLFALILVIWMLVDDSIVVVENINRHLEIRDKSKSKLDAILDATWEVWPRVVFSTITKILAFVWMFAVSWMMWEFMWTIPRFAIIALLFSAIIALSLNPWISYNIHKSWKEQKIKTKITKKLDIRNIYLSFMKIFIKDSTSSKIIRKWFKFTFWVLLIIIMILPIYLDVFKFRMLPKSNVDQAYIWIDLPRWSSVNKSLSVEKDIEEFFFGDSDVLPDELKVVKNISSTIWTPFMWDFASMFRWWSSRVWEHQISTRINLIPKQIYDDRIYSEDFIIKLRPLLQDYILKRHPDIEIRLLEDPPGPPIQSTFELYVKWWDDKKDLDEFTAKIYREIEKMQEDQELVDLWNSFWTTYRKININLDHDAILRSWLSSAWVADNLNIIKNDSIINLIKDKNSNGTTNLILWVNSDISEDINILNNINFINPNWLKVPLNSIASIDYNFVSDDIITDDGEISNKIYSELAHNSVVYPIISLMKRFSSEEFLWGRYIIDSIWLYEMIFRDIDTNQVYTIKWAWEWELTIDTFIDMWKALLIAILAIYFMIVGVFKSFRIAYIIMIPFLLWFFGIFPGFSLLYVLHGEYFNATGMIWTIALAGIVVGNSILLVDYINTLKLKWWTIEDATLEAGRVRFMPIMLTSIAAILWAIKIVSDPVWAGLAWSIVWWLWVSSILTLIVIPIFYYDSQKKHWDKWRI